MSKKIGVISAIIATIAISACAPAAFDSEQTLKDAAAGAVVGAGANYIMGEDVATGALVGAAGGAAVSQIK